MIKTNSKITDFHFANYRFSFRKLQIFISFRSISFRFAPFRFANYSKPYNQEVQENITSKSSALLFQIVKSAHLETIPWTLIIFEKTAANSTHPDCRFRQTLFMNFRFFLGKERPPFWNFFSCALCTSG